MSEFDKENHKVAKTLIRKAQQMDRRSKRVLFFNAAILSVYGWQMAVPVLLGIVVGMALDRAFPNLFVSWTLNMIILGFGIGIYNANHWVRQQGIIRKKRNTK